MKKTLEELNLEESTLMEEVESIYKTGGTIEEKTEKVNKAGIFSKYKEVHKSYIAIIKTENESQKLEAIKRALFIQWIGSFEPSFITGIYTEYQAWGLFDVSLEIEDMKFVYSVVDTLIEMDNLEPELFAMLCFYISWDFVFQFEPFLKFINLQNFIRQYYNSCDNSVQIVQKFSLNDRGQMGKYWLTLSSPTA